MKGEIGIFVEEWIILRESTKTIEMIFVLFFTCKVMELNLEKNDAIVKEMLSIGLYMIKYSFLPFVNFPTPIEKRIL